MYRERNACTKFKDRTIENRYLLYRKNYFKRVPLTKIRAHFMIPGLDLTMMVIRAAQF